MKQREYHVGPGAVSLLLIIVVVSMSVLGLLSLISARGDYKLTERAAQLAAAERQTAIAAEEALARLDGVLAECAMSAEDDEGYIAAVRKLLPEGMTMDGRIVSWEQTAEGGRTLMCSVEALPLGSGERFLWKSRLFEAAEAEGYEGMNFDMWE